MNSHQSGPITDARIERLLAELNTVASGLQAAIQYATKADLQAMEGRIRMDIATVTAALTKLSTAADALSVKVDAHVAADTAGWAKVDKLIIDTEALIAAVQNNVPVVPPELEAAVTAAQASADAADAESTKVQAASDAVAAAGDKVDAEVAKADTVLPKPAPAGA